MERVQAVDRSLEAWNGGAAGGRITTPAPFFARRVGLEARCACGVTLTGGGRQDYQGERKTLPESAGKSGKSLLVHYTTQVLQVLQVLQGLRDLRLWSGGDNQAANKHARRA